MKRRSTIMLAACLWSAGCSYMTDFSQKELDFSVLHEVEEETSFVCNNDCDCTLLGPCFSCLDGFCGLAENADHDGDRYLNEACTVSDRGCESLPDKYKPKKGNDCNDEDPLINPGMTDTCNGIDDNCNGLKDEDAATFGPSPAGPKKLLEGGFHFSFCPFGDTSFIAWDNAPLGSQVHSGFFDASGTLLNNELLSEEGFGPDIACVPDGGPLAAYSDRSEGKAVIVLQKLDTFGGPQDGEDPVRIDDGTGTGGDMTDAAVAYLATTAPPLIAVAWLIHDISDIASAQVNVTVLDSITGDPVTLSVGGLPTYPFTIPGNYPNFSFERLDLETFLIRDSVTGNIDSQGFALLWNTPDGIYFAAIPCIRDTETSEMSCTGNTSAAFTFPGKTARLPDLEWAGDRFFVVAAVTPSEATPTDLGFAQILQDGWAITEITLQEEAQEVIVEGRAQAYPSLEWVESMNEVILSWANEDDTIENRVVKFARLMQNTDTGQLGLPVPMVYTVSGDPVFAGAPQVVYRQAALIEGFTVGWTERDSSADGGVEMNFRLVSCVGSGR